MTAMTVREAETLTPRLPQEGQASPVCPTCRWPTWVRFWGDEGENTIRELRWTYGLCLVYKTVDIRAAEFDAATPYYFSCIRRRNRAAPARTRGCDHPGSAPNRIGQASSSDGTCVHARRSLARTMTPSWSTATRRPCPTDYDMSGPASLTSSRFTHLRGTCSRSTRPRRRWARNQGVIVQPRRPDLAVLGRASEGRRRADSRHHP